MSKIGVKETKESLNWLFDLTDAIISANADGKITLGDAPKFWGTLIGSGAAVGGINDIPKEIADMDAIELDELVNLAKERFNINDERLEAAIENILFHALQLTIQIAALYKLNKK